jgi:hypothetical protein
MRYFKQALRDGKKHFESEVQTPRTEMDEEGG